MPVIQSSPVQQLDKILKRYEEIKGTGEANLRYRTESEQIEIITSMIAAVDRLAPEDSYYLTNLNNIIGEKVVYKWERIPSILGVIKSLKTAYESGFLIEIEELIHADLFSDFLDMGEYLLKEGFKDPAAVIIGGVLEEHLRKLCIKNSIDIKANSKPKKAEMMNTELSNGSVYNKLDQKSVTAWLDLRNKAAHGKYSEYTDEQVNVTLLAIRDFIARFPA
jgi:hypothetical protein